MFYENKILEISGPKIEIPKLKSIGSEMNNQNTLGR